MGDHRACFAKCGFDTLSEVSAEENEWMEFQGHMDCPHNFDVLLNVNKSNSTTIIF
jgi:hypothetical protein